MNTRLGWTGLLLASILMACGQPQAEVAPPTPQIPPKPAPVAFKPTMLGSVTIDFDSSAKTATAHFDRQTRVTSFPAETDFKFTKAILQAQTPTTGTNRFLTAQFSLENLNAVTDYSNVTLIAYHKRSVVGSENVGGSAFTNIIDFSGATILASDLVKTLKPAHGMTADGVGGYKVDDAHADMQIFTPSETSTIETDAQTGGLINNGVAGEGVLSYGYVARNASNGRSIVHGTTTNSLTIGLQVPQSGDAGSNAAYRYSETFLIFADNVTRVTESLEEQAASGAGARATALAATEVRYLCGSGYAANNGVFIPGAKTVGVSSVLAYLGGNLKITDNTAFNFAATGNTLLSVNAASGLLTKYATLDGTALGTATGGATSTNGGNVSVATDGSFTFNPKVNSRVADTFSYSVAGCSAPALKAPVSISNMVWYIDSSAAVGGDGRSGTPLQSVSSLNVSAPNITAAGDFIYVKGSTGSATLTLKNNQQLIGSGVDLIVGGNTLQAAGTAPVMTSPVTVVSDNTISGLTVGGISGTVGGTLTVSSASVAAGAARAINLSGGTLAVSLTKVDSSGGVNNISLSNTGGTFTVSGTGTTAGSGGTLSGATSDNVLVSGVAAATLKNMNISGSPRYGVNWTASSGTSALTLTKVAVSNVGVLATPIGDGLHGEMGGSAAGTLTVSGGSSFSNAVQGGIDVKTLGGSSAVLNATIQDSSITDNGTTQLIVLFDANTNGSTAKITGNTVSGTASGIGVKTLLASGITAQARVNNNSVDNQNTASLVGGSGGVGIQLGADVAGGLIAEMKNNVVTNSASMGYWVNTQAGTAKIDIDMQGNTATSVHPDTSYGMRFTVGILSLLTGPGTGTSMCVNLLSNTFSFNSASQNNTPLIGIRMNFRTGHSLQVVNSTPNPATGAQLGAFWTTTANNVSNGTAPFTAANLGFLAGTFASSVGSCNTPTF